MAATIIGNIVELEGSVQVKGLDGITRLVHRGDPVYQGDLVVTGANGRVMIDFLSGKSLELGRDVEVLLDESVHRADPFARTDTLGEVEALQTALIEGTIDINELEATAAGEEAGAATASRLRTNQTIERDNREGHVDVRGTSINDGVGTAAAPNLDDDASVDQIATTASDIGATVTGAGVIDTTPAPPPGTPPTISGDLLGAVVEDGMTSDFGALTASDADPGDTPLFIAQPSTVGSYGVFRSLLAVHGPIRSPRAAPIH